MAPLRGQMNSLAMENIFLFLLIVLIQRQAMREEGWRWTAERPVQDKVPEGGQLSIFSLFLPLLFCLKIIGLRAEGLVRFWKKLSVWKHT